MTQKVLVSGASGYVAAHVLKQLLNKNYFVRATVRSQAKADIIAAKYPQYKDKLEFVIVEDIGKENAFEGKLDGLDGVFHVASPFHFKITKSNKEDLLDPAVNGTTSMLTAASKVPSIKRVVITSSFAAILDPDHMKDIVYTEKHWNPVTYEQAVNGDAGTGYRGSKKFAEKAAHDFVAEKKPQFDIVTINPPFIFGPVEHHLEKLDDLNESANMFYQIISGKKALVQPGLDIYADVRDVAAAHILGYEKSEPNQRYLITNGNFSWQEVVEVAQKHFPGQTGLTTTEKKETITPNVHYDNSKSIQKLGLTYHTNEETFKDTIAQLLQFQKEGK